MRLRDLDLDVPGHPLLTAPTVNVGLIRGGTTINVTPDRCTAGIDVRFGPGGDPDAVTAQIAALAPPGVALRRLDFKPAVESAPESRFVQVCAEAVAGETGSAPRILGVSYYSDGAILLDGLDVPFAILGPGTLGMSGQRNETCPVQAVTQAARMYVHIAEEWLG